MVEYTNDTNRDRLDRVIYESGVSLMTVDCIAL